MLYYDGRQPFSQCPEDTFIQKVLLARYVDTNQIMVTAHTDRLSRSKSEATSEGRESTSSVRQPIDTSAAAKRYPR